MMNVEAVDDHDLVSRNDAVQFAERTRANLVWIEQLAAAGEPVHPITQLVNSLLGLLVFLRERNYLNQTKNVKLSKLVQAGWPAWDSTVDQPKTLRQLLRHLRNSIAHGGIQFSSDSKIGNDVRITFTDRSRDTGAITWQATIASDRLRDFVLRIVNDVDQGSASPQPCNSALQPTPTRAT
jgi:hypothetical protein